MMMKRLPDPAALARSLPSTVALFMTLLAIDAHAGARILQRTHGEPRRAGAPGPSRGDASPDESNRARARARPRASRLRVSNDERHDAARGVEDTGSVTSPRAASASAVSADVPLAPKPTELTLDEGVRLRAQGGVVRRSLAFSQDVYGRLRSLNTSFYVYRMDAAIYPTFSSIPLGGHVGLIAAYESAFAGDVHDADFGTSYPISHSELRLGLRFRRAVRGHELGFEVTLGRLTSGLDDESGRAGTPDASYSEARSCLHWTLLWGSIRATGAVGFRVPFSYGEIARADWFPRLGGYAVEASTDVSYLLSKGISVDVSASLRRYVLEMNSEPEDAGDGIAEVAGGAVDAFLGGYVGMSFAL